MAVVLGAIISCLLIFFVNGLETEYTKNDDFLTACSIRELISEVKKNPPVNLQRCDHIIFDYESIKDLDNETKHFIDHLKTLRQGNPNLKVITYVNMWRFSNHSIISDALNLIRKYDFNGISINLNHQADDKYKIDDNLIKIYHNYGKIMTLFCFHCDWFDRNPYYGSMNLEHINKFDFIYVDCGIHEIYLDESLSMNSPGDSTVRIIENIAMVIDKSKIIFGISFCPILNTKPLPFWDTRKYDLVCEVFNNYTGENIKSEDSSAINSFSWYHYTIVFNSGQIVKSKVNKTRELGLGGVMATGLECDNTVPQCLGQEGRYQLFNAIKGTEENEDFDYPDYKYESSGQQITPCPIFFLTLLFILSIIF